MSHVLFIVGEPGVGKTTLARRFIEQDSYLVQSPKWTVGEKVCGAGHYTGSTFDGADTVPYAGVKAALDFYERELTGKRLTIFDGDRFSYEAVFSRLKDMAGVQSVNCALLVLSEREAKSRRDYRGSKQSAAWVKGRKTKADRFAQLFKSPLVLPAINPTSMMESFIRDNLRI